MDKYLSLKGCAHKSIPTGILLSSNPVEQLTIGPDKAVHGAIYFGSPVLSRPTGAEAGIAGKIKIVLLLKEEKNLFIDLFSFDFVSVYFSMFIFNPSFIIWRSLGPINSSGWSSKNC